MVAQLVERSLPTPEVPGLSLISETIEQFATNCNSEKKNMKEKEAKSFLMERQAKKL